MSDLDFVLDFGSRGKDGYMITKKDRDRLIREAKKVIQLAERLEGKLLVTKSGNLVTTFHGTDRQQKRFVCSI